jgi:hypothetical protein
MNSYKCPGNTPIIVASAEQGIKMTGTESGSSAPSIPVPSAEFVKL